MKNILHRNLIFLGFLILLPVVFIFLSVVQTQTPQIFEEPDDSYCTPFNSFPDPNLVIPRSFKVGRSTGNCHAYGGIIHFQQQPTYPFYNSIVYHAMFENIIVSNEMITIYSLKPMPMKQKQVKKEIKHQLLTFKMKITNSITNINYKQIN